MRNKYNLVLISSILENCNNLLEKTLKIGQIARYAAIFEINWIYLLKTHKKNDKELPFIKKIFEYLNTPQYLRKKRFAFESELKHVGTLPPLATYLHHITKIKKELKDNEIREGLIVEADENSIIIDIGIEEYIKIKENQNQFDKSRPIYLKIKKNINEISYKIISFDEGNNYMGYRVKILTLSELFKEEKGLFIGTSRRGLNIFDIQNKLKTEIQTKSNINLLFGSPKVGIFKLFKQNNLNIKDIVPYIINFIPNQGVRTIRTEEAIPIVLSTLNSINSIKS